MSAAIRLAIVGLGKIARDQHLPAIAATDGVELAAIASRNAALDGVPSFATIEELLAADVSVDAVALCTPPQGRFEQAHAALHAGLHVFLEKPPGATLAEILILEKLARLKGVTLFASWHSRFAPCVGAARTLLADNPPSHVRVTWKEDVRHWHPGQQWIWEPGGLGVFDPGINALSILTAIVPQALRLDRSDLSFPANRAAPIAASLGFSGEAVTVEAEFDWRQTGPQIWDIEAQTRAGTLLLSEGGARLTLDGDEIAAGEDAEYRGLYARFVELVRGGQRDVDVEPLVHVADAFMLGRRHAVEAFEDEVA
ncbi:Gfo/Idh/MocA family protein [Aureimonas mangrovi]|uniref:Gfo/Idh/MocA family protein n=1 Tax=Aureimonas mangrovi TaxID=2758041 RepID=UPI00163D7B99|nr:Gfo/Idh/MocA family oxidoreductase [Aureimonas mangrovi]